MTNRKIKYWVIPPKCDAEFAANMEAVLETYDPACPVLCMDEQPVQLIKEIRKPIEATADHPKRVDYEYVIVVCDNLNTHTKGAFYESFEPERARQLAEYCRERA